MMMTQQNEKAANFSSILADPCASDRLSFAVNGIWPVPP
jgi:hypothetical protein